ncbi:unnamed protein product, partial [Trichobilharzia regenti]
MSVILNYLYSTYSLILSPSPIFFSILILLSDFLLHSSNSSHQRFQNGPQKFAIITTGGVPKPYFSPNKDLYDSDYSRKVNVKVSDILTRQAAAAASSSYLSTPPVSNSANKVNGKLARPEQPLKPTSESHSGGTGSTGNQRAQIVVKPSGNIDKNSLLLPSKASQHSIVNEDRSWPPEHSHEFERVDVRVLGSDLQNEWMSIETPLNSLTSSSKSTRSTLSSSIPKPDNHLLSAVEDLNFTVFRSVNDDGLIYPIKMTNDQVNVIKMWLLQRATCPMEYIWEDLGPLFWPRWIRRVVCINTHSCSWPP